MAKVNAPFLSFNAGRVSKLALGRVDVSRLRFAAEIQTNFPPRVIGPMSLRTGLQFLGTTRSHNRTQPIEFVFGGLDTAIIEQVGGASVLRVRVFDEIIGRNAVDTAITNGDFGAGASWTLTNSGGATSSIAGGLLTLSAVALGSRATAEQNVTIAAGDQNIEHGIRIVVSNGPVGFQIGTATGTSDLLGPFELGTGTHSLAFTPTSGNAFVQFISTKRRAITVDSCTIEAEGDMELPIPWDANALSIQRTAQSGDVVYVAVHGVQQRKIERRAQNSWSIVLYQPEDGPFRSNASADLLLTPSATSGNITLEASAPFYTSALVGSLIRLFQNAQERASSIGAEDTFTEAIRVAGVGDARTFVLTIAGTWTGDLTLQRSFDSADAGFLDFDTYSANTTASITDTFDNSIVWYRIGFKTGDYGSGTADLTLSYPGGGGAGIVRITSVTDNNTALAEVLSPLSSLNGTRDWQEGDWSSKYGFPSAVTLYEGRLFWFGQDRIWGSVSDAFESFDIDTVGDSWPINRSIGYGPVDVINWGLPLQRLILGLASSEASVRSTAFDQPLGPTNFSIKDASTQGSENIAAVKVDTRGIFVQRSARRLYQLLYSIDEQDYNSNDLTALLSDLGSDIVQLAVQRQPDTRIHAVMSDGTVLVLVFEPKEEVICFYDVETDGAIESVAVLPGTVEDQVYYYILREVNGQSVRYVEKFALESECIGADVSKLADSFIIYSGAATTSIAVPHLEGKNVVVWGNGKDLGYDDETGAFGTFTVTNGVIQGLPESVTDAIVGLPYTGRFKSAKLAYGAQRGTAINQKKKIDAIGLILRHTHMNGIEFGQDFETMDPLPKALEAEAVDPHTIHEDLDLPMLPVPGGWDTDSRLCLRATAPRPCTVIGASIGLTTHERV